MGAQGTAGEAGGPQGPGACVRAGEGGADCGGVLRDVSRGRSEAIVVGGELEEGAVGPELPWEYQGSVEVVP